MTALATLALFPLRGSGTAIVLIFWALSAVVLLIVHRFTDAGAAPTFMAAMFLAPVIVAALGFLGLWGQTVLMQISRGYLDSQPPGIADLNPFTRRAAWGMCGFFVVATGLHATNALAWPIIACLAPAWILLMSEESVFAAFSPVHWWVLLKGLGVLIVPAVALITLALGGVTYSLYADASTLVLPFVAYGYLLAHALVGRMLYWRRHHLDWPTDLSPEQTALAEHEALLTDIRSLLTDAHRLCSTDQLGAAHVTVDRFLQTHPGASMQQIDPIMHTALQDFQDQRLMLLHALDYLHRLHDGGKPNIAWGVFRTSLEHDPQFRPRTGAAVLAMAEHASTEEDAAVIEPVLADFARAYPEDELIPNAEFRRARLLIEVLGEPERGSDVLRTLQGRYPRFAQLDLFKSYWADVFQQR